MGALNTARTDSMNPSPSGNKLQGIYSEDRIICHIDKSDEEINVYLKEQNIKRIYIFLWCMDQQDLCFLISISFSLYSSLSSYDFISEYICP